MILVFIHGAPATGKYTIGRELAALTGFELYHNHLVVDDVLTRHPFGTPEFIVERDRAWRTHLEAAAHDPFRKIIFTFNPEDSVPQEFIDWLFTELTGAMLHSVRLDLAEPLIESRLASAQRQSFRKLTDLALYRRLRDRGAFARPRIPRTDLAIDTGAISPPEAAALIVRQFRLT